MHLTIVSPFPPTITGIGQYGYHVTRALARSRMFSRITVLAGSSNNGVTQNHLGLTEVEYCWGPGIPKARRAILSRVRSLSPDLLWFNLGASVFGKSPWLNVSGLLTPMLAQRLGYPTVVTLHELVELSDLRALHAPGGPLASLGARLLTSIATQADVTCLTMRNYAELLAARQVDSVHIPIGAYHEPRLLDESDSQEILFFTTLAPFKGLELLLEAFLILRTEYPRLQLNIAGSEHARFPNYPVELRRNFNGTQGIHWLGQIAEDHVMNLFRRAQIVVLPYTASTGSSSVLYQAATWGRPVVASDLPEIRALIRESNLFVEIFKSGDVNDLCNAIRAQLNSPEKRRSQSKHNFNSIQNARPESTCRKYIEVFNYALKKHGSANRIQIPSGKMETE
ncbi:MAG TPA: glycosyltransferase [Anaerolineales bacterium]|nr:glycosyltransferase [Anaerolineales bacterium]